MVPEWPPCQVLVNGGTCPTLNHLKRAILSSFKELLDEHVHAIPSVDNLIVCKLQPETVTWQPLLSASDRALLEMLSKGGGNVNLKKTENISQSPFFVKEGDQLCAFCLPPIPSSAKAASSPSVAQQQSHFVSFMKDLSIARAEDISLRALQEQERALKAEARKAKGLLVESRSESATREGGTGSGATVQRVQRKEILLSIGRSGSFSDDECEGQTSRVGIQL